MTATILVHGGAGSDPELSERTDEAARIAREALETGGSPLEAACHATAHLEDDPRFNAGTGSRLRADGATVQMDAACMGAQVGFGAVACVERVRHPVFVARHVLDTEHMILAGDGAQAFARARGMPDHDPTAAGDLDQPSPSSSTDTVGCVVRAQGTFAAALSSGGTEDALVGRVGDVPLPGAGLHAGPAGAVAATGHGETIARRLLALRAYERLEAGHEPATIAEEAISGSDERALGVLVLGETGGVGASNRTMAWSELALDA